MKLWGQRYNESQQDRVQQSRPHTELVAVGIEEVPQQRAHW